MKTAWLRVTFAAALWVSALMVQSIGLLHGYVHPHGGHAHRAGPTQVSQDVGAEADTVAHPAPPAHGGGLQALFAGHDDGSAGCTLFDQLTHADLLHGAPVLALAFAAPAQPDAVHAAWHHATQVTGFLARAPPPTLG